MITTKTNNVELFSFINPSNIFLGYNPLLVSGENFYIFGNMVSCVFPFEFKWIEGQYSNIIELNQIIKEVFFLSSLFVNIITTNPNNQNEQTQVYPLIIITDLNDQIRKKKEFVNVLISVPGRTFYAQNLIITYYSITKALLMELKQNNNIDKFFSIVKEDLPIREEVENQIIYPNYTNSIKNLPHTLCNLSEKVIEEEKKENILFDPFENEEDAKKFISLLNEKFQNCIFGKDTFPGLEGLKELNDILKKMSEYKDKKHSLLEKLEMSRSFVTDAMVVMSEAFSRFFTNESNKELINIRMQTYLVKSDDRLKIYIKPLDLSILLPHDIYSYSLMFGFVNFSVEGEEEENDDKS